MSASLSEATELLGLEPVDGSTSTTELTAVSELLVERLLTSVDDTHARLLAAAVCECQELLLAQVEVRVAARAQRIAQCERGLGRLRTVTSVDVLVDRACDEAARSCGLERVLLSRVDRGSWSAWKVNAVVAAEEWFVEWAGREVALSELDLEVELAQAHRPALVADTAGRRVHPIIRAGGSGSFVAAPLGPEGGVVGFFHADHGADGPACDSTDRDVLWAFAEGFAHLYERTALLERLREQRGRVRETLASVDLALERLAQAEVELVLAPDDDSSVTRAATAAVGPNPGLADLTRREQDILAIVAEGATNAEIAERLVLSTGTVKTHVKHVLAKLGAVNRSQAIGIWIAHQETLSGE